MRVRLSLLWAVFVFAALIGPQTGSGIAQEKRATPPTAKDLVGVWIGFDSDQLTFTRLDLRAARAGFWSGVSPADTILHDQGVRAYRITKWDVIGWNIEIHMSDRKSTRLNSSHHSNSNAVFC